MCNIETNSRQSTQYRDEPIGTVKIKVDIDRRLCLELTVGIDATVKKVRLALLFKNYKPQMTMTK